MTTKDMTLTGKQVFWLIVTLQVVMTVLLTIGSAVSAARQDAWISYLVAGAVGVGFIFIVGQLNILYPNRTFVEYSREILGKWLGTLVAFVYFLYFVGVLAVMFRQYADLIVEILLPRTPVIVPMIGMMLVVMYVAAKGPAVIGRCGELFGPLVIVGICLPLILTLFDAKWRNLLPVYADGGWRPILRGAVTPVTFFGDSIMLAMLLAFTRDPRQATRQAVRAGLVSGLVTMLATLVVVAVFGPNLPSGMLYPFFMLIRYVSIADFFENFDAMGIVVWVTGVFVKLSIFMFANCYGIAQWLGIRKWKRIIWFVAPLAIVLAMTPRNFIVSSVIIPRYISTPYFLTLSVGILPLLWIVALVRKKGGAHRTKGRT